MNDLINSPKVSCLVTKVEEAARATEEGVKHFIEPAPGTLKRAVSRRHHIVFGRRGSGKSSLLRKAAADLTVDRRPIAYVNLEAFKGHSYPDVLLSVLIAAFREFKKWLNTAAVNRADKTSFWQRLFGTVPSRPSFNRKQSAKLSGLLQTQIADLELQLHAAEEAEVKVTASERAQIEETTELSAGAKSSVAQLGGTTKSRGATEHGTEVQQDFKQYKTDFLHRHIMDYQQIFREIAALSQGDSYLVLDDLYHIRRADQPKVLDYFHRIAKDHGLWLKAGTIKHRTEWYFHGDPPVGVKLGDDADEIDLDITLEKYELAKQFLMKVLGNFAADVGIADLSELLTGGATDRLILASGGVARDFLSIFRRSVDVSRERFIPGSGPSKITAEDVNVAAGEYDSSKREEFKRDTGGDDQKSLDYQFQQIRDFCLEDAETNCFLLDKDAKGNEVALIHELVDLKLLHLIRSRVTVSGRSGNIFEAYMLDLSQYAGSRKRRGLDIIEFWKPESKERLRRASLIYPLLGKSSSQQIETLLARHKPLVSLTAREIRIVELIVEGYKNKEIASQLGTTEQVIKNYLRNIYEKVGVSDRLELSLFVIRQFNQLQHHTLNESDGQ
jgi:DNA-binding CsgD family transcriptional regulator